MKVLVADDSVVSRHLMEATVRRWGYDPVVVSDGCEAWSRLAEDDEIRLVLLDWMMPGMDGLSLCKKVRAELDDLRYVYIIMVTSKSLKEELITAFEAGVDAYLTKPFNQAELLGNLRAGERILRRMGLVLAPVRAVEFYSCFVSYSSADEGIARRINDDLRKHGITYWYAPQDLKIGDRFRLKIDESIRVHDKLLLILSQSSISSRWVESEVEAAFEEEKRRIDRAPENLRGNVTVLFPIRLDDSALDATDGWVAEVRRTRHIGDFRNWRDPVSYGDALCRLLRDLATSEELDRRALETRRRLDGFVGKSDR